MRLPRTEGRERRRVLAWPAVLAAAAALAGCGGASGSEDSGSAVWPLAGRTPERTSYLPASRGTLDPPLRRVWSMDVGGRVGPLPIVADGIAYLVGRELLGSKGSERAIRLADRKLLWARNDVKAPAFLTEPTEAAYDDGRLFVAFKNGELTALDVPSGEPAWKNEYPSAEFGPIAAGGSVYVSSGETDLLGLDPSDGETRWRFRASERLTASPAYDDGRLYVPASEGILYCLDAENGEVIWRIDTTEAAPPSSTPRELLSFALPAAGFGHVYVSRNDARFFAVRADSGRIEWSFRTPDTRTGTPAVAEVPGTQPTVYLGSYRARHFYAFDALTGEERWRFTSDGELWDAAVVIGRTVYLQGLEPVATLGLDVRTGRKVFELPGATNIPVSDGEDLYFLEYPSRLIRMRPGKG